MQEGPGTDLKGLEKFFVLDWNFFPIVNPNRLCQPFMAETISLICLEKKQTFKEKTKLFKLSNFQLINRYSCIMATGETRKTISQMPIPLAFPHHFYTIKQRCWSCFFRPWTTWYHTCCSDDIIDNLPGDRLITKKPDRSPLIKKLIKHLWPFNHFGLSVVLRREGDMGNIFLKSLPLFIHLCKKTKAVRNTFVYLWRTLFISLAFTTIMHLACTGIHSTSIPL